MTVADARPLPRLAVLVAERCGWLLDVQRDTIARYLGHEAPAAPPTRRNWTARERWSIEVSPQFDRTLALLGATSDDAAAVHALLRDLPADPDATRPNSAAVRTVEVHTPPMRIAFVLLPETHQIYVLAALPTEAWEDHPQSKAG